MKHNPYVIMNQAPITQLNTCQQIPHCNSFIRGDIMINNNIMLHHILANFYVRFFKWLVIENVLFSTLNQNMAAWGLSKKENSDKVYTLI